MGANDQKVYTTQELAPGQSIVFAATGITDGDLLRGVKFFKDGPEPTLFQWAIRLELCAFQMLFTYWEAAQE